MFSKIDVFEKNTVKDKTVKKAEVKISSVRLRGLNLNTCQVPSQRLLY